MILEKVRLIDEAEDIDMLPYELEDLERTHPGSVTEEIWKEIYSRWIQTYLNQAYGGFKRGNFITSQHGLFSAEKMLIEARERGLLPDESVIGDAVGRILDLDEVNNFTGNQILLSYINGSKLDLKEYEKKIVDNLPELAREYSKDVVKNAKNKVRRMKRLGNTKYLMANDIQAYLNTMESLGQYGVHEEEKIAEIRERAYKSILFALNVAKNSVYANPGKSERWAKMAVKNASVLGYDVSYHTGIIDEMRDSFGFMEVKNDL